MLEQLKSFELTRMSIDEMIALSAFGRYLQIEYAHFSLPVPEWLDDRLRTLGRAIATRVKDQLELRLKEVTQQEKALLTPSERREALAREREALTAQLSK